MTLSLHRKLSPICQYLRNEALNVIHATDHEGGNNEEENLYRETFSCRISWFPGKSRATCLDVMMSPEKYRPNSS
ncbi:uncharacterized [Tachysurus ichikawai]